MRRWLGDRYGRDSLWGAGRSGVGIPQAREGDVSRNKKEILADTIVLDLMGVPRELGQKITLEFDYLGHKHRDTFTVSGIYGEMAVLGASQLYLSKEYVEEVIASVDESDRKEMLRSGKSLGEGLIQAEVFFKSSRNIEENARKVLMECGFADNEIDIGVNWAYLSAKAESMDVQTVLGVVFILVLIGITGYLVIYNIFWDLHCYGYPILRAVKDSGGYQKADFVSWCAGKPLSLCRDPGRPDSGVAAGD